VNSPIKECEGDSVRDRLAYFEMDAHECEGPILPPRWKSGVPYRFGPTQLLMGRVIEADMLMSIFRPCRRRRGVPIFKLWQWLTCNKLQSSARARLLMGRFVGVQRCPSHILLLRQI
jgi:hypothetical protein